MERTRSRRVAVVVVVMYGMVERLVLGGRVRRNSGWVWKNVLPAVVRLRCLATRERREVGSVGLSWISWE